MAKLDLNEAFRAPEKKVVTGHRTYDVRITLNKSGRNRQVIRFGFINNAAEEFGKHAFIEASNIEYTKDRIYFRSHDEKINANVHTLSSNGKTREDSCYFSFTPSDRAEKMYRMNWIGKLFPLFYDNENELHYIDMREEN
jgi:hypothetical protein